MYTFFFSSRRRHTRLTCDWSSDVCSSDLSAQKAEQRAAAASSINAVFSAAAAARCSAFCADAACWSSTALRSEERRVGKECRSWWSSCRLKKKNNHPCGYGTVVGHAGGAS